MKVEFLKDGKQIQITMDVEKDRPESSSGKTLRVASSEGNKPSGVKDPKTGKEVIIGLNAYVYAKDKAKGSSSKKGKKSSDDDDESED